MGLGWIAKPVSKLDILLLNPANRRAALREKTADDSSGQDLDEENRVHFPHKGYGAG